MSLFGKPKDAPCGCEEAAPPQVLPRFCGVCGSVLVMEVVQTGFNEKTGCHVFDRWMHCPRWTEGKFKSIVGRGFVWPKAVATNGREWVREGFSYSLSEVDYHDCKPAYVNPRAIELAQPEKKAK